MDPTVNVRELALDTLLAVEKGQPFKAGCRVTFFVKYTVSPAHCRIYGQRFSIFHIYRCAEVGSLNFSVFIYFEYK